MGDELSTVIGKQDNSFLSADSRSFSSENVTGKSLREARPRQNISDGYRINPGKKAIPPRGWGQSKYDISGGGGEDREEKTDQKPEGEGSVIHKDVSDKLQQEENMKDRKLASAHELFVTPILDWNTEQWLFFLFLIVLLSFVVRIMRRIHCCGCDLMDCLACWCCYEMFFDPTPGYDLC